MKRALIIPLLLLPAVSQADVLGFTVGANAWQQNFSGDVTSDNGSFTYDVSNDLDYGDTTGSSFYASFEHFIPLVPNFRLEVTDLKASEIQAVTPMPTDGNVAIQASVDVDSTIDLSHVNATAYYELLDNWVSLDLGVTVALYDNGVDVVLPTSSSSIDLDNYVPMLYGAAKFELPLTGMYTGAQVNYRDYDDMLIADYSIAVGYETDLGFGAELGYRSYTIEDASTRETIDVSIDGAYAGIFFAF